jgi:hypothetical protein
MNEITMWESEPWRVQVDPVGRTLHVHPVKGLLQMGHWRVAGSEYARKARALKRRIQQCQRVCDRENARETKATEILHECTGHP